MAYIVDVDIFKYGYKVYLSSSDSSQSMWIVNLLHRRAFLEDSMGVYEYPLDMWFLVLEKCIWQKKTASMLFKISQASTLKNTDYLSEIIHHNLYIEL
tara:strand:+ start:162 stop:455 length:294 start_codon:yes stop_codon:yes gene_type:complete